MGWHAEELSRIAATDDLRIAPFRSDGKTYGTLTWIWSVVVDGELYVRAYNGQSSRWYQAAKAQEAGRITAGGSTHEVALELVDDQGITPRINEAYRRKYAGSPYLTHMIGSRAQSATVRIVPTA
ncbi:DUF2255 family protein [Mesorhizobium sp. B3-2-1]|uniref:DUF2255 family protein n=1 Tax=Mesorhizobium sp. B3-2-1 TaxID=2589891 RepID=UPI00112BC0F6|nr:DUF2255 family protein [Mesorhizobium sp. B3-2-1]TPI26581.1 DUF2255 family protein [Mesorhizobium sp. B3-2-1]